MVLLWLAAPSLAEAGRGGGHAHHSAAPTGTGSSSHSHAVRGYTKKNGTYVAPHRQSDPDHTQRNNYTTKGNVNPHTGAAGTRNATH
jgi:hypothetical protein